MFCKGKVSSESIDSLLYKDEVVMTAHSNTPSLFSPEDAFRGPYAARIAEFTLAGRQSGLSSAEEDTERVALVLVDYQHDFVDPSGTLYVPGSQEDVSRFLAWFYANAQRITSIYASLDTHLPFQIFYGSWWLNPQTGEHTRPSPPMMWITAHGCLCYNRNGRYIMCISCRRWRKRN